MVINTVLATPIEDSESVDLIATYWKHNDQIRGSYIPTQSSIQRSMMEPNVINELGRRNSGSRHGTSIK